MSPSSLDKLQISLSFLAYLVGSSIDGFIQKKPVLNMAMSQGQSQRLCLHLLIYFSQHFTLRGYDPFHLHSRKLRFGKIKWLAQDPRRVKWLQPRSVFAWASPGWEPFPISAMPPGLWELSFGLLLPYFPQARILTSLFTRVVSFSLHPGHPVITSHLPGWSSLCLILLPP